MPGTASGYSAPVTVAATDVRFVVPIYTMREAAGYLAVPERTFASWVKGYRRQSRIRPPATSAPLITALPAERRGDPTIPFIELAEGMFLSALREAGVPMPQIRPALELVRKLIADNARYARRLDLPHYEVARITADPEVNFGEPYFAHSGTPLSAVRGMLRAGEPVADIANDFGLPVEEIMEFAYRERLLTA